MNTEPATDLHRLSFVMDLTLRQMDSKGTEELFYDVARGDLRFDPACPLCQARDSAVLTDVQLSGLNFFETSVCHRCLHVWRSISPGREWFQARWKQIASPGLGVFNPELEKARLARYHIYYALIRRYVASGRLLDIGAAYGTGVDFFRHRGFDVEALEVEDDRARYINERLGIVAHHSAVEDFKPSGPGFDVILFAHCLEHLDDPRLALSHVAQCLEPKRGLLYLEVPLPWALNDWGDALYMAHKHNFMEVGLDRLIRECGLTIVEKFAIPEPGMEADHLGMLLTRGDAYPTRPTRDNWLGGEPSLARITELYHLNMPHRARLAAGPIHYHVPYINNFFYIVRLRQGAFHAMAQANHFEFRRDAS
jgi:SAM-dependent methyltransferase